jgi:hypothetical protein
MLGIWKRTFEPLVLKPSPFEVEVAIAKLERYKSPGTGQVPAELIQAGGETLWSEVQKLVNSTCMWNKEELPEQWRESIILPVFEKGDND